MAENTGQQFTALDIATAFLQRYYEVLNGSSSELFRFYSEDAVFSHGVESENTDVVSGIAAVKDKLDSLKYDGCTVQLAYIDANYSFERAVVIVTVGHFSDASGSVARKFTQTFVLHQAEGEDRLFIRNHSFLFLDGSSAERTQVDATAVPEKVEEPAVRQQPESSVQSAKQDASVPAPVKENAAPADANEKAAAAPQESSSGAPKKKRWAELFSEDKQGAAPSPQKTGPQAPRARPGPAGGAAGSGAVAGGAAAAGGVAAGGAGAKGGARPDASLWIGNIGDSTVRQLREAFSRFGVVAAVDVNTKGRFAFVDMGSPEEAARAVDASKDGATKVGGNALIVERRKGGPRRRTARRS